MSLTSQLSILDLHHGANTQSLLLITGERESASPLDTHMCMKLVEIVLVDTHVLRSALRVATRKVTMTHCTLWITTALSVWPDLPFLNSLTNRPHTQ